MYTIQKIILIFIILVSPSKLFAQYEITKGCEQALMKILNLRLHEAQDQLNKERLISPNNYYIDYLENYKDMVEILVLEDKSIYEKYLEEFEKRLDKLNDKETKSPYYRAVRAEMIAQTGIMNGVNGDEVAGFLKIVKANNLIKKNFKEYPDFFLTKKLYGAINVGVGNIPPSVKWAANSSRLKGDTDTGFKYLESYQKEIKDHPALFSESLIYMIYAYQICADDQGAYEMLKENFPSSVPTTLGTYLYANALDRVGRTEESLKLLENLNENHKAGDATFFPIILLTGKGKLNRLDQDADIPYLNFLQNSKSENHKKETCNKLSLYYLMNNQADKYEYYKNEAKKFDKEVMRPDREAAVDINRTTKINVDLLKTHFLINGGYFNRADSILKNIDPEKQKQIADEIHYYLLKGKIMCGEGKDQLAFFNFDMAIRKGKEIEEHYAAESALMAGNLAYKNRRFSLATKYYKLSLTIKCENNVYLQTIQRTAKAQLRKLKKIHLEMI